MRRLFLFALSLHGLLAVATAALNQSLTANRINQPKKHTVKASAGIEVEYETQKLPQIRKWVIEHSLVLEDLEPKTVGRRYAGLSSMKGGKQQLAQIAERSGLLRRREKAVPFPGVFYVAAKRGHGREVRRYLKSIQVRPEVHGHFGFTQFSEIRLFQCKVPEGEERFWVKAIQDHPGISKVGFTGDSAFTGQIRIASRLSVPQERALSNVAQERGLFFENRLFGHELTLYVPPGDESGLIRLLAGNGIHATLAYMPLDGSEILSLPLKASGSTTSLNTPLTLNAVSKRLEKGMRSEFPQAAIVRFDDDWGFRVEDTHKGVQVLKGYDTGRWERVRIQIHVGGFKEGNLRIQINVMTWTTGKLGESPPTNADAWVRYREDSRSTPEDAYAQQLGAKIRAWIGL